MIYYAYDLTCNRSTLAADFQWNRVLLLEPSDPETEILPLGGGTSSLRRVGFHKIKGDSIVSTSSRIVNTFKNNLHQICRRRIDRFAAAGVYCVTGGLAVFLMRINTCLRYISRVESSVRLDAPGLQKRMKVI
ncbi:hypothetical protein AVEN_70131-1 [Araneus ventricosus]|uniref:Uncharacterized protein n=1 Tax=Araneus ventricosus TaxID=182803 RepID=A0A4Y2EKT7_ARAVE|nr:hypothetical protein AVEN_70131-1 [Araneus ventricosus]